MLLFNDSDPLKFLTKKAAAKGVDLADLVNDLLKKDIELIETGG